MLRFRGTGSSANEGYVDEADRDDKQAERNDRDIESAAVQRGDLMQKAEKAHHSDHPEAARHESEAYVSVPTRRGRSDSGENERQPGENDGGDFDEGVHASQVRTVGNLVSVAFGACAKDFGVCTKIEV
jgi:hypothetical protein